MTVGLVDATAQCRFMRKIQRKLGYTALLTMFAISDDRYELPNR